MTDKEPERPYPPGPEVVAYKITLYEGDEYTTLLQDWPATSKEINVILKERFGLLRHSRRRFVAKTWEDGSNAFVSRGPHGIEYTFVAITNT